MAIALVRAARRPLPDRVGIRGGASGVGRDLVHQRVESGLGKAVGGEDRFRRGGARIG